MAQHRARRWAAVGLAVGLAGCFTDSETPSDSTTGDDSLDACIAAGTMVLTPAGERPIESLQVGDVIWSIDPATGAKVRARVTAIRTAMRECMALTFGGGRLVCTSTHPLYDPRAGAYASAGGWVGERRRTALLQVTEDGVAAIEVAATESFVGIRHVYDLTVDVDLHNFVAGGIVVHNKSIDPCQAFGMCDEVTGPVTSVSGSSGDAGGTSSTGDGTGTGTGPGTGTGSGTTADTGSGTVADSGDTTAACVPITEDPASIGVDCGPMGVMCPPGYTCQGFAGVIFTESCQILCEADCECPTDHTCEMVSDKGNMWTQCMPPM